MDVRTVESARDLDRVRRLFRAHLTADARRRADDLDPSERRLDEEAREREMAGLPGEYAPPDGCLVLCEEAGLTLGCAAFRRLDDHTCELTRMFVAPVARRHGVGRALTARLVECARAAGYRSMCLEAGAHQTEAIALCTSLGFTEVTAYHDVPDAPRDRRVFLRLEL